MAHFLSIDQLLTEAQIQGIDDAVTEFEEAAQKLAEAIADKRGDVAIVDDASYQDSFGGLCVGFGPVNDGEPCPDDFAEYDSGSDWASGGEW